MQTANPPRPARNLHLDLSSSRAKLARASEHLDVFEREGAAALKERNPCSFHVGDINRDTGWVSIYLEVRELREPHLGVILGDVMHNLRCALDYIVTALVDKAGAR